MHHFIFCLFILEVIASALKFVEEVLSLKSWLSSTGDPVIAEGIFVDVVVMVAGGGLDSMSAYRYTMPIALHVM